MEKELKFDVDNINLTGNLSIPGNARSIVIFSHGSGSSRFSPRNNFVAKVLTQNNIATFLTDLLTPEEDEVYQTRFDIELLTNRLIGVTKYIRENQYCRDFSIGYFGASTGAASALCAASVLGNEISAVVSRGGRADLAGDFLQSVKSPTLLIVGGLDTVVISLNEEAYQQLICEKKMIIVRGASHLFEEPGTLEEVAGLASKWFKKYL